MIGLLKYFEGWTSTFIGALNDSEFALLEDMVSIIIVRDALLLTGVVGTSECSTVKHSLFNWMQLINGLNRLVAALACGLLRVFLTWAANQFVALFAVTSIDSDETTVYAKCGGSEHRVGSVV